MKNKTKFGTHAILCEIMKATQSDRRQEFTLSDYYSDNEHPNGLDFKDVNKISKYREAITKLQRRCESLSQNNERLVRR